MIRDVVVLLPGILGSVLQRDGRDLWSTSGGAIGAALMTLGASISELRLADDPIDSNTLDDGVSAPRVMDDAHLLPGFWKVDGYARIRRFLRSRIGLIPGENFFEFPYDWRRDNRVAARKLGDLAPMWLRSWQVRSGAADAKLVLIAHSMGGLVARYFVEVLGGWKTTRALITLGTPYRGSVQALSFLATGFAKRIGPFRLYDFTALLRSFSSVYQLLPIFPAVALHSSTRLQRVTDLADGIPSVDTERAQAARAFHDEMLAAAEGHRQLQGSDGTSFATYPIVGIRQRTLQSVRLGTSTLEGLFTYDGEDLGGDGTVPRVSATPIELSHDHRELFVVQTHAALQNTASVLAHIEGVLTHRRDLVRFRGWSPRRQGRGVDPEGWRRPDISLDVDDAYSANEPVVVRAVAPSASDLGIVVEHLGTGLVRRARFKTIGTREGFVSLGSLPVGTYRVTVVGRSTKSAVSSLFVVLEDSS